MASFALKTLLPVCAVYLAVACASAVIDPQIALALDVAAIFYGIFGPAVVNHGTSLDLSLISFPHLAERFELITIITFGEAVVTVAEVAEHFGFGTVSLMTFSVVVLLFGCYVVFMHNLVEHRQLRRGLRLIYCHFFIVIAVNLFTVSLNLLVEEPEPTLAVCGIGATAIAVFFLCLFLLAKYLREGVGFAARDWTVLGVVAVAGCVLTFAGLAGSMAALFAGPLVAAAGCFVYLLYKDKGLSRR